MKRIVEIVVASLAFCAFGPVAAETFPTKTIKIVVGFAPGGSTDLLARLIARGLSSELNGTVVVENKLGAGGVIAADAVAKAAPDGYTLLSAAASIGAMPVLYEKLPFKLYENLMPITIVGTVPFMLVTNPSLPVNTVQELIAYARANPGKLTFGSGGNGTIPHLGGELFKMRAGIEALHIPYKGGAKSTAALLSGEINYVIDGGSHLLSQIRANNLKLLAVSTPQRLPEFPSTPTISESGLPGFEASAWQSLWVTGGTSAAVRQQLSNAVHTVLHDSAVVKKTSAMGIQLIASEPDEAKRFVQAETEKWRGVVKASGAKKN